MEVATHYWLIGKGFYPKPPDMRQQETQNKSDGELYYTIENGIRLSGMPAFGEEHAKAGDMETWNLVLFIRHLPNQTAEELQQMEPKAPSRNTRIWSRNSSSARPSLTSSGDKTIGDF